MWNVCDNRQIMSANLKCSFPFQSTTHCVFRCKMSPLVFKWKLQRSASVLYVSVGSVLLNNMWEDITLRSSAAYLVFCHHCPTYGTHSGWHLDLYFGGNLCKDVSQHHMFKLSTLLHFLLLCYSVLMKLWTWWLFFFLCDLFVNCIYYSLGFAHVAYYIKLITFTYGASFKSLPMVLR